jgi:beta-fructofuranosidase
MGVGCGLAERGGAVLLYQSADLRTWRYLHPLAIEQPEMNDGHRPISTGWECPDYFFIEGQPVLLACEWDGDPISSAWWRGKMTEHRFTASSKGFTDAGDALYAPQTFLSEDGRRLFFGWLRELRPDADQVAAGWSGVMSLPREVLLRGDGTLGFRPAEEVERLRGEPHHHRPSSGPFATSAASEILVSCQSVTHSGLELRWDDTFAIRWDGSQLHLSAGDRMMSGDIPGDPLDSFVLRVFIDHSVIEVYLSDRIVMSTRVYVDEAAWDRCTVVANDDLDCNVTVWQISSIW